jgi:hypothetical protein
MHQMNASEFSDVQAPAWTQTLRVSYGEGSRLLLAIPALYKELGWTSELILLPNERALISLDGGQNDPDIGRVIGATQGHRNMVVRISPQ